MKNVNKEDVMSKAMMAYSANDHYYYPSAGMSVTACRVKRVADVIVSLIALIIFSPVFLLIYALIKQEDGGPAIFSQERIGYGGKPFILYKFRSMSVDSESDGKPALCQKNDSRLTRIGRFLREHHLDELPQLWNVLKGEMSFVGPVRSGNILWIRSKPSIRIMNCCIACVRDCFPRLLFTTVTLIRWKRCWNA